MTVEKRGDMKAKCKKETGEKTCQETGKMTEYMYKVILNSTHHKRSNAFFFLSQGYRTDSMITGPKSCTVTKIAVTIYTV